MTGKRLSLLSLSAIACGSVALWVSFGTLAVTSGTAGGSRVGLLPSLWWLAAAFALLVSVALVGGGRRVRLLWLSSPLLAAWLPMPVPAAAMIWTGPLRWWVWTAIAAAMTAPAAIDAARAGRFRALADPRRAPLVAGALAAVIFLLVAWRIAPQLPAGDEPHYLVIAQSLLKDGDLKIENNHARGDYHEYFAGVLKPDYLARGLHGDIYSVHAPGLAAIVAPVFALFGYPGVLAFLAFASACGTALAWRAAWLATGDAAASWFGWAAVSLSVPFLFQAFTVYPDGFGATLVMAGMLTAMLGERASTRALLGTGLALACLPWLHTRFAITAGALGLVIVMRQLAVPDRTRRLIAFAALPAMSAAAWFSFFYVIYGSPNPAVVYHGYTQSAIANIPRGLLGWLIDQQFGILLKAPVYLCALAGIVPLARRRPRVAGAFAIVVVPYALVASMFYMWWGGFVSPARFLASTLLLLAIPAAAWYAASGRGARILGLGGLLLSVLISAATAWVDRGALLYDVRDGAAKTLAWLSPLVDLSQAAPSLFQTPPAGAAARAAFWLVAVAATAGVGVWLDRRRTSRESSAIALGLVAAAAGMTAASMVWRMNAAHPQTPGRAGPHLLHAIDGDARQIAVRFAPLSRVRITDVPPLLPLMAPLATPPRPGDPVALLIEPPAAVYTIEANIAGGAGHLTAGVDRQPAVWDWDLSAVHGPWRQTLTLGNDARALRFDADPATRAALRDVTIHADRRLAAHERVSERAALSAARYGRATVFLLDGTAFLESGGSWIAGGSSAEFAILRDPGASIQLFVRNSAVDNIVVLEAAAWREEFALKAREERSFDVPVAANAPGVVLRVRSAKGVRPADTDPGNHDRRMLGCWIETR